MILDMGSTKNKANFTEKIFGGLSKVNKSGTHKKHVKKMCMSAKKFGNHMKRHHKKYVGGLFAGFAIFNTVKVLIAVFGILITIQTPTNTMASVCNDVDKIREECLAGKSSFDEKLCDCVCKDGYLRNPDEKGCQEADVYCSKNGFDYDKTTNKCVCAKGTILNPVEKNCQDLVAYCESIGFVYDEAFDACIGANNVYGFGHIDELINIVGQKTVNGKLYEVESPTKISSRQDNSYVAFDAGNIESVDNDFGYFDISAPILITDKDKVNTYRGTLLKFKDISNKNVRFYDVGSSLSMLTMGVSPFFVFVELNDVEVGKMYNVFVSEDGYEWRNATQSICRVQEYMGVKGCFIINDSLSIFAFSELGEEERNMCVYPETTCLEFVKKNGGNLEEDIWSQFYDRCVGDNLTSMMADFNKSKDCEDFKNKNMWDYVNNCDFEIGMIGYNSEDFFAEFFDLFCSSVYCDCCNDKKQSDCKRVKYENCINMYPEYPEVCDELNNSENENCPDEEELDPSICLESRDNDNFLNSGFWNNYAGNNFTGHSQILCALYGSDVNDKTAYTEYRSGWQWGTGCPVSQMNVIETGTLPNHLSGNTVYVLNSSSAGSNVGPFTQSRCSAVISKMGAGTVLGTVNRDSGVIGITAGQARYLIYDNLVFDGFRIGINLLSNSSNVTFHNMTFAVEAGFKTNENMDCFGNEGNGVGIFATPSNHSIILDNTYFYGKNRKAGIGLYLSGSFLGDKISNIRVTNSEFRDLSQGLYAKFMDRAFFENLSLYSNENALYIQETDNVFLNNINIFHTSSMALCGGGNDHLSVNNSNVFNNYDGFSCDGCHNVLLNNVQYYNNARPLYVGSSYGLIKLNNIFSYNNKSLYSYYKGINVAIGDTVVTTFYGNIKLFSNDTGALFTGFTSGGNYTSNGVNWSALNYSTTGKMSWDYATNPINASGVYLLDWKKLFTGDNNKGYVGNTNFIAGYPYARVSGYSYGINIRTQEQPVIWSGDVIVATGTYNPANFIGSNIQKLNGLLLAPNSLVGSFYVTGVESGIPTFNKYSIFGGITSTNQDISKGTRTQVTMGTGDKFLVTQIYQNNKNNFATHFEYSVDTEKPTCIISTTSGEKLTGQIATLNCTDNVGVTQYYWGTSSGPANSAYTTVTSSGNFTTTKRVSASGTYYLIAKDAAGNVSVSVNKVYRAYKVQNILDKVAGTQGTYTTTNYETKGNVLGWYIIPSGSSITLTSGGMYGNPLTGHDTYKGYRTTALSTTNTALSTGNPTINSNVTYYRFHDRDKHKLSLLKGDGIATVSGAGLYKHGATASISATLSGSGRFVFGQWDVHVGNTPDDINSSNTTVFIDTDTELKAVTASGDTVPPSIVVSSISSGCATGKVVSANVTDTGGVSSIRYIFTNSTVCNSGVLTGGNGFPYTNNSNIILTSTGNGKYVCFMAVDVAGNRSYAISSRITNIVDQPISFAPTLQTPFNHELLRSKTVNFSWDAVAYDCFEPLYCTEVCSDPECRNNLDGMCLLTGVQTWSRTAPGAGTYYWRVRAQNLLGSGRWSEIREFTISKPICLQNWNNDNFLTGGFWSNYAGNNFTGNSQVLCALYGSGENDKTAYTKSWTDNGCDISEMNVIETGILPTTLSENTVYVLTTGKVSTNNIIEVNNCSAIVSKSGSVIYSLSNVSEILNFQKRYQIMDNVGVDGYNKAAGGTHTKNNYGIVISELGGNNVNTTLNNVQSYNNNDVGIDMRKVKNVVLNNVQSYNNINYGIKVLEGGENAINNTQMYNNGQVGLFLESQVYVAEYVLNNVQMYNNGGYGLRGDGLVNLKTNDMMIFNNGSGGIQKVGNGTYLYYGELNIFGNKGAGDPIANTGSMMTRGTTNTVGWSQGVYTTINTESQIAHTIWNYVTNPKQGNGGYLLSYTGNVGSLRGVKTLTGKVDGYSYGVNTRKQEQVVGYSGTNIGQIGGVDTTMYVGGTTKVMTGRALRLLNPANSTFEYRLTGASTNVSGYQIFVLDEHTKSAMTPKSNQVSMSGNAGDTTDYVTQMVGGNTGEMVHEQENGDIEGPSVVLTWNGVSCTTGGRTFVVTGTFSEDVTGVTKDDLVVNNGSIVSGSFVKVQNTVYRWQVKSNTGDNTIRIYINSGSYEDLAGNVGGESNTLSGKFDDKGPTYNVESSVKQECVTGTINVNNLQQVGCASANTNAYSWNGGSAWSSWGTTSSYSMYNGSTGTKVVSVRVRDSLGNYTEKTGSFKWNDTLPTLTTSGLLVGTISGQKITQDLVSEMGPRDGACGVATMTLSSVSNCTTSVTQSGVLTGNSVKITPKQDVEGSGSCVVVFKDDEGNSVSGTINFYVDTKKPTCNITEAGCTSGSLLLSLSSSEAITKPNGWIEISRLAYTMNVTSNDEVIVKIVDTAGNTGSCSITPTHYDIRGPAAPTGLTVLENNNQKPTLRWNKVTSDNGCSSVAGYNVQVCSNSTCSTVTQSTTTTSTGWTVTSNLTAGTQYYWRVRTKDALGNRGTWSSIQKVAVNKLTFNATTNGGTTSVTSPIYRLSGTTINLLVSTYSATKTGWSFVGWNTTSSATGSLANVTLSTNKTVYAIFKKGAVTYTVTYTKDTGSVSLITNGDGDGYIRCTIPEVYNGAEQSSTCNITVGNISCKDGYSTPKWNLTIDPLASVSIGGNRSFNATCSDSDGPSCTISTTAGEKRTSQTVTLNCTDNVGVVKYYWGTSSNPAASAYTTVTSSGNFTTTKTVNASGTYYLIAEDVEGNTSVSVSKVFRAYKVLNIIDKVGRTQSAYTTTNYMTGGVLMGWYIIPNGTTITLTNSGLYGSPLSGHDTYIGYRTTALSTTNSALTTGNSTITGNVIYYRFHDRDSHNLSVNKGTGISSVSGSGTYKHGATVNISATVNTSAGYNFGSWTVNNGNTPTDITSASTTIVITENTKLTANALDTTPPVCTWGTPTNICVSGGLAGTISLVCTDGVGISQTSVNASNVKYNTGLLVLGNSTEVTGTQTTKTYVFTYTGKTGVNGSTGFILKADAVKDINNNGNVQVGPSTSVQVDNNGPASPTLFTVMENNNQKPTLIWNKVTSDNGCSSVAGYNVQVCSNSTCSTVTQSTTTTSTGWTVTSNLTSGTQYYWRVRTKDVLGNRGTWSSIQKVAVNKLTFNATTNGGTTSVTSPIYRLSGTTINLSVSTYSATKTGWSFVGWNTTSSATGSLANVTLSTNKTVYAIFKKGALSYTMSFVANGNTISATGISCQIPEVYNTATQATQCTATCPTITAPNGFTVIGFSNAAGTHTNGVCNSNGSVTLNASNNGSTAYAQTKKDYSALTITWNVNGNGGSNSSSTCTPATQYNGAAGGSCTPSGTCPTITAPTATPTVIGWSAAANTHTNGVCSVGGTIPTISSNKTYYAQTKKDYSALTITWNVNGNGGSNSSSTCTPATQYNGAAGGSCTPSGTCPSITAPTATPTVIGWSDAVNTHTNGICSVGGTIPTINSNKTYYAQTKKDYSALTITWNVNGNGGSNSSSTCTPATQYNGAAGGSCAPSGTCPSITAPTATPTVIGWSNAANTHTNGICSVGGTIPTISSNKTYYAQTKTGQKVWTVNFVENGNTISATSVSKTIPETYNGGLQVTSTGATCPTITAPSGFTVIGFSNAAGTHTNGVCNSNGNITLSASNNGSTAYAQTKSSQWTYGKNFDANNNTINATSKTCTTTLTYNGTAPTQSCTVICPKITAPSATPTVIGFSSAAGTHDAGVCTSEGSLTLNASNSGTTAYAQTKKTAVTLTAKWNANGSTLSSTANKTCTLAAVYNGVNQSTSCTVDAPTVTVCTNTPTFVGFNTSSSSTSNNSNYNISTKKLTLTSSNDNQTWYAITKKDQSTLTMNFNANGNTISATSVSKTIPATYNCTAQATSTGATCPTITAPNGFTVIGFSNASGTHTSGVCNSNGSVTLNASNNGSTAYAQTKKAAITYTATYTKDSTSVSSITTGSTFCQIPEVYNGALQSSSCSITLGDIICKTGVGYGLPKWNTSYNALANVSISSNTTFNATCSDITKPMVILTGTSNLKVTSQTATLKCTDGVGITAYYRGQAEPTSASTITTTTASDLTALGTSAGLAKTITTTGTYWLGCKDAAGNWDKAKLVVYSYEVHNMLNAINKAEGTYNTTNYPQASTGMYIALSGTMIPFSSVYTVPTYSSTSKYVGKSATNNVTLLSTATGELLNGNKIYYFWFNRNLYSLTLNVNAGINMIYYQVNGATGYTSTSVGRSVSMKAGSTAKAYATASTCYTCDAICKNSTSPQTWNTVTAAQTYTPTATENTNNITYGLNGGLNNPSNPSTYKITQLPITLGVPQKTGYTFVGWTGSNGTVAQTGVSIGAGSCGDKTYNANWKANIYNISYTLNNGTYGTNHPTTATYDVQFTVNNPTRAGYTFSGWKITGMDNVTHTYGSTTTTATSISKTTATTFKNLTSVSGATVIFEALWIDNIKPVCAWNNPSVTPLRKGATGEITLTCTDVVGISTSSLSSGDIVLSNPYITLSNATVGGTATSRTFKFIYTAVDNVEGSVTLTLPTNKVKDTSNNYANSVTSNVINVDSILPTCTISENPTTCTSGNITLTMASTGATNYSWTGVTSMSSFINNKIVTINGTYRGYVKDEVGNTGRCSITVTNFDNQAPNVTVANVTGYECDRLTGSVTATDPSPACGSLSYSWSGGSYGTTKTYGITKNTVGSQNVQVKVKDGAGNVTTKTITYTWLDRELVITGTYDLVFITGTTVINNLMTAFNVAGYGSCETVTIRTGTCVNANMVLSGTKLTINPTGNRSGTGSCSVGFTDGDTTKTGLIIFRLQTLTPQVIFTGTNGTQINPTQSCIDRNRFITQLSVTNTPDLGEYKYMFDTKTYNVYDSGLILMYNFDNVSSLGESTTKVKDMSNNGYDGTIYGATWTGNGVWGGAYNFSGTANSYIKIPNYGALNTNGTISLWVKGGTGTAILVGNYNGLAIGFGSNNTLIGSTSGLGNKQKGKIVGYNSTGWNHIVVTINNGTIDYYVNGYKMLKDTATSSWTWSQGNGMLGMRYTTDTSLTKYAFKGQIDELRIYNRALSLDEVQFLYRSNLSKTNTGTWLFKALNTCLDKSRLYNYTGYAKSLYVGEQAAGLKIQTCIPDILFTGGLDVDFGEYIVQETGYTVRTGYTASVRVEDWIGRNGWTGSVRITSTFSGQNTSASIASSNFKMKNSSSIQILGHYLTGIVPEINNGLVSLSSILNNYNNIQITGGSQGTPYFVSNYPVGDFMCNGGIYADKPEIQLDVPAWQIGDTYKAKIYWTIEP